MIEEFFLVVVAKNKKFAVSFIIFICCRWCDQNWQRKRECWNICCAAAWCKLRAASIENLCEAKLIENGKFEANLKAHQMWGDVV